MPDETGKSTEARDTDGRWKSGQSGNPKGRPKGARSKLNEALIVDLLDDWEEHGKEAIRRVREDNPVAYVTIVARLVPAKLDIGTADPYEGWTDEQLEDRMQELAEAIRSAGGKCPDWTIN